MRSYLALCLLFFVLSCRPSSAVKAPIPEAAMVNILRDMHTIEAAMENESVTMKDSISKIYYAQVLEKYGFSRSDLDTSLALYAKNPMAMDSLYKQVMRQIHTPDSTRRQ
jgi:hypothetical protein